MTRTATGKRRAITRIESDLLILRMLADGCTYAEVAMATGRMEATVRAVVDQAKRRAGARTTPHLFRMATEHGLFEDAA